MYKQQVLTGDDRALMLSRMHLDSAEDLYPDGLLYTARDWWPRDIGVDGEGLAAQWLEEYFRSMSTRNRTECIRFLGAGCYDHYIHPAVTHLVAQSGFLTSYTPYQPEMSQGVLGNIFDFQSYICSLTGMEVANASLYNGASALLEATLMAFRIIGSPVVIGVHGALHPQYREVLVTHDIAISNDCSQVRCVVVQIPGFLGDVCDLDELRSLYGESLLIVVTTNALSLSWTGGCNVADIVAGEAGSLAGPLSLGGTQLGFLASKRHFLRKMPGRIVGQTVDIHGNTCYSLILSTREQHIRKSKATSNVCTNQCLYAAAFAMHCDLLGTEGLRMLAAMNHRLTNELHDGLLRNKWVRSLGDGSHFNEFCVQVADRDRFYEHMVANGIVPGVPLGSDGLLVAVTEKNSLPTISSYLRLASAFTPQQRLSDAGHHDMGIAYTMLARDMRVGHAPVHDIAPCRPSEFAQCIPESAHIVQLSEREVLSKYVSRAKLSYGVDDGIYPLGSCTMKFNSRVSEKVSSLFGIVNAHPMQPVCSIQGSLEIVWTLSRLLCAMTGMCGCTLSPCAGAHGELTGLLLIKRMHEKLRNIGKDVVLIPANAHGTNFASAAMAGYRIKELPASESGIISVDALKDVQLSDVACLLITNPNTYGLWEANIADIANVIHAAGAYLYCDGANFNAMAGVAMPAAMGIDVMQLNLHKTFAAPHGGGGPGCGPVLVTQEFVPLLPVPSVTRDTDSQQFNVENFGSETIGRIGTFFGQVPVMVKALSYVISAGSCGIQQNTKDALLTANYVLRCLRSHYHAPYPENCMHECLLSDKYQRSRLDVESISKILIDCELHPMTICFPSHIRGAMLIEPTETQSLGSIDYFIAIMRAIAELANSHSPSAVGEFMAKANSIAHKSLFSAADINANMTLEQYAQQAPIRSAHLRVDQVVASEHPVCSC